MKSGSRDIWVTSDLHFGHANVCKFLKDDGSKTMAAEPVFAISVNHSMSLIMDENKMQPAYLPLRQSNQPHL